jgi:hypothetical protein
MCGSVKSVSWMLLCIFPLLFSAFNAFSAFVLGRLS